jgi:hypothetical protein
MVVSCEQVWHEISNYLEGEINPVLQRRWRSTFGAASAAPPCSRALGTWSSCTATNACLKCRWDLAIAYKRRLDENVHRSRRSFLGWMVAAAATVVVVGGVEVARSSVTSHTGLRSEHAQPGTGVPPDMLVPVSTDGKTFHASGCPFIHDKAHLRTIAAREALQEGYAPCVRCMKKYLKQV